MMKTIFYVIRTLCGAIFFYSCVLCGMEKEIVTENIVSPLILNILVEHTAAWLSHDIVCSLAINKKLDVLLRNTAAIRKNRILENPLWENNIKKIQWHKYGSACGRVYSHKDTYYQYSLSDWIVLQAQYVGENFLRTEWEGFQDFVPYKPKGFFNKEGDFCVYACGEITNPRRRSFSSIVEYCLCADGQRKSFNCVTDIYKDEFINLRMFIEFPYIMSAFLRSSKVLDIESKVHNDRVKVFRCSGITLPKNYKKQVQYFPYHTAYKSFDDLPKMVKETLIDLYKKQKKENKKSAPKKKSLLTCFGS